MNNPNKKGVAEATPYSKCYSYKFQNKDYSIDISDAETMAETPQSKVKESKVEESRSRGNKFCCYFCRNRKTKKP